MTRTKREPLSVRKLIFRRDSYICYICLKKFPESDLQVDHLYPVAKGGTNDLKNLFTACRNCNSKKRDKLDFTKFLDCVLEDPSGDFIWVNRKKILNELDLGYFSAALRLWHQDKLEIRVGVPKDAEI